MLQFGYNVLQIGDFDVEAQFFAYNFFLFLEDVRVEEANFFELGFLLTKHVFVLLLYFIGSQKLYLKLVVSFFQVLHLFFKHFCLLCPLILFFLKLFAPLLSFRAEGLLHHQSGLSILDLCLEIMYFLFSYFIIVALLLQSFFVFSALPFMLSHLFYQIFACALHFCFETIKSIFKFSLIFL